MGQEFSHSLYMYPGISAFRKRRQVQVSVSQRPFVSGRPSNRL
jgi:hypothetical protein